MNNKDLANLLFPNIDKDINYYEEKYPKRDLDENACVTRFAPSPTGFIHMGSLYAAFISNQYARQSNGVFYLRIEDTDQKRMVENGITGIVNDLQTFNFIIDEGPNLGGNYGPYIQSERKEIYQTYIKHLVEQGLAYPCFCTKEELDEIREKQEAAGERIGYYGKWAINRNLSYDEIKRRIDNGDSYVIRIKSPGDFNRKVVIKDLIKGKIEFPENDMDIVIMKSDGLPTYHFAHIIDDHLMHTTNVIRGDEWLSSTPLHYQLFKIMGFDIPKYAHIAPLTKKDGDSVRKLSKRYDPECSVRFYYEKGIPYDVIKIYLATLINADFEDWYNQNSKSDISEFKFEFKKMSVGGTLFDYQKLLNISKTYFSRQKATVLYDEILKYYKEFDEEFYNIIKEKKDYTISVIDIERYTARPRKDMACYADFKDIFWYMYDEYYDKKTPDELFSNLEIKIKYIDLLEEYINNYYNPSDTNEEWFNKIKELSLKHGYPDVKTYKKNPEIYKGHVGDICELIRVAVTSKKETPNLYDILNILGKDRIMKRINIFKEYIGKLN